MAFNFQSEHPQVKPYQIIKVHSHDRVISLFTDHNTLFCTSKDNFLHQYSITPVESEQAMIDDSASEISNLSKVDLDDRKVMPKVSKTQQIKEEELNIIY